MFLITVKQQTECDPLAQVPTRRQRATDLKQLADWCHAFIRSCAMMGWKREKTETSTFRLEFRSDFDQLGIEKFMILQRAGLRKFITIEIDEIPDQPASVVAEQIAR